MSLQKTEKKGLPETVQLGRNTNAASITTQDLTMLSLFPCDVQTAPHSRRVPAQGQAHMGKERWKSFTQPLEAWLD